MPQLFSRQVGRRFRLGLFLGAAALAGLGALGWNAVMGDRAWGIGLPAPQPIGFSHALHAGRIGLDCRYCHATVERAAGAGMPAAETCLGCHNQVWNVAATFAPLRTALAFGAPVEWRSVHRLPEHARFHHAAHLAKGVGCATCHGPVETMERTVKVRSLSMGWCLDCHRDPGPELRSEASLWDRTPPPPAPDGGRSLVAHYGIPLQRLTDCSTCHR